MHDYAVPCPSCNFVLRFHDPSLLGRKARCPQCHLKFLLSKPAERSSAAAPAGGDLRRPREAASTTVADPPKHAAPVAVSTAPPPSDDRWLCDGVSCGFGGVRKTQRRRALPDPLRVSHAGVIALGAFAGSAAALLWPAGPTPLVSCLCGIAGGLLGAGLLAHQLR